jgi:hypothetical protein
VTRAAISIVKKALAANISEQDFGPAAQLQPGNQNDQQRQQQYRNTDEHQNEVAGGALPAIDEAQVMNHEHAKWLGCRVFEIEA